ncbi:hypothetical protein G153_08119 [Megasphaera sp. BL7]|nr:hypothetical protein G153_08119 [Megasphaera sp. BL7]EPP18958.1 hypothetical protein NM10_01199 [Megasphaera sp. NM10]
MPILLIDVCCFVEHGGLPNFRHTLFKVPNCVKHMPMAFFKPVSYLPAVRNELMFINGYKFIHVRFLLYSFPPPLNHAMMSTEGGDYYD